MFDPTKSLHSSLLFLLLVAGSGGSDSTSGAPGALERCARARERIEALVGPGR